jgi:hypothetical protein
MVTNTSQHFSQDLVAVVVDAKGKVTTPRVIEPGRFGQPSGLAIRDPVANARHEIA